MLHRGMRSHAFALCMLAGSLFAAGGCSGCRREPVLRLTYEVDVSAAFDGDADAARILEQTRKVLLQRLDATVGGRSARVSANGNDVFVDLAAIGADALSELKSILARSGRLEFDLVDDAGSAAVFGAVREEALPRGEEIALYEEDAPDGLDAADKKRVARGFYARIACRPPSHAEESASDCLGRFRAWASTLSVPGDHRVAFEAVTTVVPGTQPPQFAPVGWRTLYVFARPELTNDSIADATRGRDEQSSGQYYVVVSFTPSGAKRFEQVTAENVNRRFAIVLDGIVDSAPVIRSRVAGSKATITMGAGDPEKQLRDAKQLELVLRTGALPAPLRLVREEGIGSAAR
jgi:preprotein translocase subunit SecD